MSSLIALTLDNCYYPASPNPGISSSTWFLRISANQAESICRYVNVSKPAYTVAARYQVVPEDPQTEIDDLGTFYRSYCIPEFDLPLHPEPAPAMFDLPESQALVEACSLTFAKYHSQRRTRREWTPEQKALADERFRRYLASRFHQDVIASTRARLRYEHPPNRAGMFREFFRGFGQEMNDRMYLELRLEESASFYKE